MKEPEKPSCSFMICCGHTTVQYLGLPMAVYMKELGKPHLFFHDSLWAYRSAIPWSAHGSYKESAMIAICGHRIFIDVDYQKD